MYPHGDNLTQKEGLKTKYADKECRQYLVEIRAEYDNWRKANEALKGPVSSPAKSDASVLERRVELLSAYKDFIDQEKYATAFDSRSNLHSTVLEEFLCYLFRDMVMGFSSHALIGKAHTFKDVFFMPSSYKNMVEAPNARFEQKDHDFVIGATVLARLRVEGGTPVEDTMLHIPAVAIECKTYLDKTMLERSSTAAEQLKTRNPNAIYLVVSEWLKLTESVNLRKFKVDQVYVLRKQKNTDREFRFLPGYQKNPIYLDVVSHLFEYVRSYLTTSWDSGLQFGLERGYLL
jgi:hypothetical protein